MLVSFRVVSEFPREDLYLLLPCSLGFQLIKPLAISI